MIKKLLLIVVILLIAIQFIRPAENNSGDSRNDISTAYPVPPNIKDIMARACYDCHSNKTRYPWYNRIQPVAWWLNDHVTEGKRHINYSEFASLPAKKQAHKLKETAEMVKKGDMPLSSYTWIHKDAILSKDQADSLIAWASGLQKQIEAGIPDGTSATH